MSDPVIWKDPPNVRRRTAGIPISAAAIDELRSNPGRWGMVRTYSGRATASGVATKLRNGTWPELAADQWEFTSRSFNGTGSELYARFLDTSTEQGAQT